MTAMNIDMLALLPIGVMCGGAKAVCFCCSDEVTDDLD
jgi:hypothetical protein